MSEMFHDPKFWMAVAFITFFVLFGKKIGKALASALDVRSGRIAEELKRAVALKQEAEALLQSYQKKSADSAQEAERIIAEAHEQANRMVAAAEANLKDMLERRLQQAMERIEQQENEALKQVRDHAIDITIAAARSLIEEQFASISNQEMIQAMLGDLDRKLH